MTGNRDAYGEGEVNDHDESIDSPQSAFSGGIQGHITDGYEEVLRSWLVKKNRPRRWFLKRDNHDYRRRESSRDIHWRFLMVESELPTTAGESLCHRFVDRLPVNGASISVVGRHGQLTIASSDKVAARLEELQFELGEGPHHTALSTGKPVMVSEVSRTQMERWPVFGAAVAQIGIGALFAFPLSIGAATVGVVDMYRETPGLLDSGMISTALSLASWTAGPALRLAALSANEEKPGAKRRAPEMRREVHQATGIILVQLGVSATEAFSRLQAHAFATGHTLEYVAHEVVARRIDFREMTN